MSSEHFFGENKFAVVDRDDTRDVAIFNRNIEQKIKNGETIIIGTCSPRREEMVTVFLKKALPLLHKEINIETKPIRGNVETRLRKLDNGDYDATILATAGINRLLRNEKDALLIKELLVEKKIMLLPLIECVPAPCQGAIVIETHPANEKANEVLKKINDEKLFTDCYNEKKEASKYGSGCIQKFGVTTLYTGNNKYLYAAGKDAEGTEFVKWNPLPEIKINEGSLFSTTDMMKDFFEYEWSNEELKINEPVVFVANYKAIQLPSSEINLKEKLIIASGTKTWIELAKKGFWVTASADAMGFEFLVPSLKMPFLNINKNDICILTHEMAADRWNKKGYNAVSNYRLKPSYNESIEKNISTASYVFWSSFSQYEYYGKFAKPDVMHLSAGGETAFLLKHAGIEPVIFPTIKSFEQWRKISILSHNAV